MPQVWQQIAEGVDLANRWLAFGGDKQINARVERIGEASGCALGEPAAGVDEASAERLSHLVDVSASISQVKIRHRMVALPHDDMSSLSADDQYAQVKAPIRQNGFSNPAFANHTLGQQFLKDRIDVLKRRITTDSKRVVQPNVSAIALNLDRCD